MPLFQPFSFLFPCSFRRQAGPWLGWAQARLMGAHPYQGPAIAGHTSKKKQAEIRKAMSVRLAIIAAEGRGGVFFSSSSLTRGP